MVSGLLGTLICLFFANYVFQASQRPFTATSKKRYSSSCGPAYPTTSTDFAGDGEGLGCPLAGISDYKICWEYLTNRKKRGPLHRR